MGLCSVREIDPHYDVSDDGGGSGGSYGDFMDGYLGSLNEEPSHDPALPLVNSGASEQAQQAAQDQATLESGKVVHNQLIFPSSPNAYNSAIANARSEYCTLDFLCLGGDLGNPRFQKFAAGHICSTHDEWCAPDSLDSIGRMHEQMGMGYLTALRALTRGLPKEFMATGRNAQSNVNVYYGVRNGKEVYVGITNSLRTRQAGHGGRFTLQKINQNPMTRGEARAIEQVLIKRNPHFVNRRNEISPAGPYYQRAVEWGEAWLRLNGIVP